MPDPVIEFTTEWRFVHNSCEPCAGCQEIIYGKQYQLFLQPGGFAGIKLCESCYMEVTATD